MKISFSWQVKFGAMLIGLSLFFYLLHYAIFRDAHHIFFYLISDLAFLFLDVLIVMLVLHRMLEHRDKQSMLKKLNMVIGTFFSEAGTDILKKCAQLDPGLPGIDKGLLVTNDWTDKKFDDARKRVKGRSAELNASSGDIMDIKDFLIGKRPFLLGLLENPNLLEHESFSELLWAVFHLTDELSRRNDLRALSESDRRHLSGDIKRVYGQLIVQWLDYMRHIKRDYPYLFSLAVRTNPFDPDASVEVK